MKKHIKNGLRIGLRFTKKAVNSNRHTKKIARRAKSAVLLAIGTNEPREVYSLSSFYPSIQEYSSQEHDPKNENGPLISILLPTYNTPETYLRECVESIIVQSYPNWELCIADDSSSDKNVPQIIKQYQKQDKRIKFVERAQNGHISLATNSALELATGEFVGLMDHDDILWPNALYEVVQAIHENTSVDFIYSDEDKLDGTGKIHSYPFLKPDFSPEFLESCNYITHFSCIRTSVIRGVGGFRKGYEGAQDWDLFIRITEKTDKVVHIPKILYSWRIHEASTASDTDAKPYVYESQLKLLVDHIDRLKRSGTVETGIIKQHRTIKYEVPDTQKLSIFVRLTSPADTKRLLISLDHYEPGARCEVFIVTDTLIDSTMLANLQEAAPRFPLKTLKASDEYDVWKKAIEQAAGDQLFFVHDTVQIASGNWAKTLLGDGQIEGVGVVGPVILNADGTTVLSAGVGIGYGKGHTDMLQGMPFDDPHYTRGLYAKSRRNVSAVNPAGYAIAKKVLAQAVDSKNPPKTVTGLCLSLLDRQFRHVYTPYVQLVCMESLPSETVVRLPEIQDRYLNPNFNHANSRMEVKA